MLENNHTSEYLQFISTVSNSEAEIQIFFFTRGKELKEAKQKQTITDGTDGNVAVKEETASGEEEKKEPRRSAEHRLLETLTSD